MPVQWKDLRQRIADLELQLARAEQATAELEYTRDGLERHIDIMRGDLAEAKRKAVDGINEARMAANAHMRVSLSCKRLCSVMLAWRKMPSYRVPLEIDQAIQEHEDGWG